MRKWTIAAAAVLGCVCASMPGCSDDGDTIINQVVSGQSFPGNFPGAPVNTYNVASDGLALSEPGFAYVEKTGTAPNEFKLIRYVPSGRDNTGILLTVGVTTGNFQLFAQHFDGSNFTAPVPISGGGQDSNGIPLLDGAVIVHLNMPGDPRDGDALIFWRRMDLDDFNSATIAGPNLRIFYSYFDRSLRSTAVAGSSNEYKFGFNSVARTVDNVDEDGSAGGNTTHVFGFGVFTDGFVGTAKFNGGPLGSAAPSNDYNNGDTNSFVGVVWSQGATSTNAPRAYYNTFDLSSSNTANAMGSPATVGLDATAFTLNTDVVAGQFACHNGTVALKYTDVATGDVNLNWQQWGSTASATFLTNAHLVNAVDGNTNASTGLETGKFGGPDDGAANVIGVIETTQLNNAANVDLFAVQMDPVTGSFNPANDREEIDADLANAGNQAVVSGSYDMTANRTVEALIVTWRQPRSTSDTANALWHQVIQTTPTGSTAPALSTRTAGSGALRLDAGSGASDVVTQFKMQQGVAPRCGGVQSDRYSWHLIWQQDDASNTLDRVRTRKVTFVPSTTTANPAALTLGTERTEDFNNNELSTGQGTEANPGGFGQVVGVDGGGAGGTTGELILYYIRDITAPASTLPNSFRAFQKIGGGTPQEIGTLVGGTGSNRETIALVVHQHPNNDITTNPNWAGVLDHIFLYELADGDPPVPGTGTPAAPEHPRALRHRFYDKDSTATNTQRFTPQVSSTSPPVTLSLANGTNCSFPVFPLRDAGTLMGIFWFQGGRLPYQQFNHSSRSWLTQGGVATPEFIDNESKEFAAGLGIGIHFRPPNFCVTLNKFIVFYLKPDNSGINRWYARVRD